MKKSKKVKTYDKTPRRPILWDSEEKLQGKINILKLLLAVHGDKKHVASSSDDGGSNNAAEDTSHPVEVMIGEPVTSLLSCSVSTA